MLLLLTKLSYQSRCNQTWGLFRRLLRKGRLWGSLPASPTSSLSLFCCRRQRRCTTRGRWSPLSTPSQPSFSEADAAVSRPRRKEREQQTSESMTVFLAHSNGLLTELHPLKLFGTHSVPGRTPHSMSAVREALTLSQIFGEKSSSLKVRVNAGNAHKRAFTSQTMHSMAVIDSTELPLLTFLCPFL